MQHQSVAQALREGPISDGQLLLLAMVIDQLAGEDGWTVHTRQDLAEKSRAGCPKTVKRRIVALVKMGYLEERKKPIPGLRLTEKALDHDRAPCPVDWAPCPVDRAPCPIDDTGHHALLTGHHALLTGHHALSPNASAYLPLKDKDLKEEEEEKIAASPSSTSSTDRVISEAVETIRKPSISDLPDQPAAQPPAVVGQGELLPVPAKAKRKKPRKNPPVAMTEDWWPMPKTIDNLEKDFGIPRAFTEVCVWEFITHWMGDGRGRPGWDSTFISSVQYSWNKEQKREKSERYTDAAGQPISERDATTRERNKRVAAALANGLFDNFDLKTKV